MRQLILMRHAEAANPGIGQSDFDRPLTDRGVNGALAQAQQLLDHKILPDKVLCSAALRTKTTWEVMRGRLADSLCLDFENCMERDLYNASLATIVGFVRNTSDSVDNLMIVGHNPTIFETALSLAEPMEGRTPSPIAQKLQNGYPPASITVFSLNARSWLEVSHNTVTLQHFWVAKN